ncbi:hypothetical protein [Caulobacter sp. LjRoot300]|jgi:hypothetical protein|uniref:hypothetical protein n=1 Tax=Caulobacter sp. LjRoot300 TaxID=3342321 RepID=UPI003ECE3117
MFKTVELLQILLRAIGALFLVSGGLQLTLAVALTTITITAANVHPASPLGIMAVCAIQMGIFSIASLASGGILVGFSRRLAHFAIKPFQGI